jgi:hypothetical protein
MLRAAQNASLLQGPRYGPVETYYGSGLLTLSGAGSYSGIGWPGHTETLQNKAAFLGITETATLAFDGDTATGHSILVAISCLYGTAQTDFLVTDNKGNTYLRVGTVENSNNPQVALYICPDILGGAGHAVTVQIATTPAAYWTLAIWEKSGLLQPDPRDRFAKNYSVSVGTTSPLSGELAVVDPNPEYIVALMGHFGANVCTAANGTWQTRANVDDQIVTLIVADRMGGPGTYQETFNLASASGYGALIASFRTVPPGSDVLVLTGAGRYHGLVTPPVIATPRYRHMGPPHPVPAH